jgi:hypothetical protein
VGLGRGRARREKRQLPQEPRTHHACQFSRVLAEAASGAVSGLHVVVRRFFGDDHVVHV